MPCLTSYARETGSLVTIIWVGSWVNGLGPWKSMRSHNMNALDEFHWRHILCRGYDRTYVFQFSSVQSLSCVWLFATPRIAACQASLSITNNRSSPKLMSIKLVMPSSHLILRHPLLLLPLIPPSMRVFSNESTLCMRWPKYWSFSFSIIPSKEIPGKSYSYYIYLFF